MHYIRNNDELYKMFPHFRKGFNLRPLKRVHNLTEADQNLCLLFISLTRGMDSMLVSPSNYMLKLHPHVMVLGGEAVGRGLGHEGGALTHRISALRKDGRSVIPSM